jgi:hypothetical protein
LCAKGWTKDQILAEDPWYIRNIVFHPRDKDGNIAIRGKKQSGTLTPRQAFFLKARSLCVPDWKIERMFEEEVLLAENKKHEMRMHIAMVMAKMRK